MLLIEDPKKWAHHNRYRLQSISSKHLAVFDDECTMVGELKHAGEGWSFVRPDTPMEVVSSENFSFTSENFSLGLPAFTIDDQDNSKDIRVSDRMSGTGHSERVLDANFWLPKAAEHYQISPRLSDYVIVPIPALFTDLPNTNGEGMSFKEATSFNPKIGMLTYKTFKGMPTHYEHDNRDITKAKGVILDSFMRPIQNLGSGKYWKIVLLLAFDRQKDPQLANAIQSGQMNSYSVGYYYTAYTCTVCGHRVTQDRIGDTCMHTRPGRKTYKTPNGVLAYRLLENAKGFECSAVGTPAFISALGRPLSVAP